ncbi:MAG: FHA domain-containing protein [Proteobacteria bacterium]|nr:FHA domain-containing protein [Pseudomonadota bacterium]
MDVQEQVQIVLEWSDQQWRLCGEVDGPLTIGADTHQDVCVDRAYISRRHAHIERHKGTYVLVDHSTNGSFVQTEDQHVAFVHRDRLRLWGRGLISFGEPPRTDCVMQFQLVP